MEVLFLLGRILLGGYFVFNAFNHFANSKMMTGYAASKGVPAPAMAVLGTGVLLLVGGLSILTGFQTTIGLGAIILFLLGVTPMMHNFWAINDPQVRMGEMVNFTKNSALLGAAIMLLSYPTPWPLALG